jgi:hypothetical protein
MTYTWKFKTGGKPSTPSVKKCHRGPMIDVEVRMSQPFKTMAHLERERMKLLAALVDTHLWAVRTRETVLRVLNGELGPIFERLQLQKPELQVLICEKLNAVDIDEAVAWMDRAFVDGAVKMVDYGATAQQVVLLTSALASNSPIQRVASRCAIILMAAFVELDGGT